MSEQSPEELMAELKALKASVVLDFPETTKAPDKKVPVDYTGSANTSYYNEKYAIEFRYLLDSMRLDRDMIIRCSVVGLKIRSLEARCYQAFKYLEDHMDTEDKKYAKLRAAIKIIKYEKGKRWPNLLKVEEGIILSWVANPSSIVLSARNSSLVGEEIDPIKGGKDLEAKWQDELDFFIQNSQEGEKFEKDTILMTQEEFDALYARLVGLGTFLIHPKSNISYLKIINSTIMNEL
jgi:hypothetical protein